MGGCQLRYGDIAENEYFTVTRINNGTREIEKILEYAKADYVTMANISEKEVIGLLFERDFEVEGVDPSETPVIEGVEPPLEEFPDWFESL